MACQPVRKAVIAPPRTVVSPKETDTPGGIECGAIAQLGERLNGIQEVVGSIPIGSTNIETPAGSARGFFMPFFPP